MCPEKCSSDIDVAAFFNVDQQTVRLFEQRCLHSVEEMDKMEPFKKIFFFQ